MIKYIIKNIKKYNKVNIINLFYKKIYGNVKKMLMSVFCFYFQKLRCVDIERWFAQYIINRFLLEWKHQKLLISM